MLEGTSGDRFVQPLLKAGSATAQCRVQSRSECLQEQRLHNLFGQRDAVFDHSHDNI